MGSDTHFDPTGDKKARKKATFGGAIICGVFNTILGVILGVVFLSISGPVTYLPKPDKAGKVPPPPDGLFYWAGAPGGDYKAKEAQFLAAQPGEVTVSDGELNSWSAATFKSTLPPPTPKTPAKPAAAAKPDDKNKQSEVDKAKEKVKAAEAQLKDYGFGLGSPNFHAFKDPAAPGGAPVSLQIALPMTFTLSGVNFETVYQVRGVFVAGASGPQFEPYYSYFGNARIPAVGGLSQILFNSFLAKYGAIEDMKKYADAWAKLSGVTVQDGSLVLAGK